MTEGVGIGGGTDAKDAFGVLVKEVDESKVRRGDEKEREDKEREEEEEEEIEEEEEEEDEEDEEEEEEKEKEEEEEGKLVTRDAVFFFFPFR